LDGPGIKSQTGPEAHLAFCTMDTGFFPGESNRGEELTSHPHLALRLKRE